MATTAPSTLSSQTNPGSANGGVDCAGRPTTTIDHSFGSASQDIANAEIYWRQIDPPNWGAYSHNPYEFTPNVEANLGPNQ
ncbi:hypothetical protein C6A85_10375, partial [Mycobacterium sp. ITM-2017-0098]